MINQSIQKCKKCHEANVLPLTSLPFAEFFFVDFIKVAFFPLIKKDIEDMKKMLFYMYSQK